MSETNERPAGAPAPPPAPDRVVVGVDGSPHSLRALDRAADEAALRGTTLEVLCGGVPPRRSVVPETDSDRERAREASREVAEAGAKRARERKPELDVVASGVAEAAPDALVRASRTAALTVIGTRGRGGFRGLLVGSVSLRLAAHAAGPLLVVRGEEAEPPDRRRETVVGLKWAGATEPVRFAFEEAARDGSPLRVVHAWTYPTLPSISLKLPPKEPTEESVRAEAFLRETVAPFHRQYPDVPLTTEQHRGSTSEHLIELSGNARVIVLGVRREHRRLGLQVGPVVNTVLQHARCSVALVPVPASTS
ncbi:universal stress protein [Streptomyces iconiensis]|uniref:Universal stress protein n=1 Tax=Streptomyces iconiensis TaxID=1384038 RepID=A0ABT6ZQ24_9ACTN|nr:universal stress protein [Streptomyces iconiensis]MDJ1131151.1 universal stress protein [Streptomyces iconiensis]